MRKKLSGLFILVLVALLSLTGCLNDTSSSNGNGGSEGEGVENVDTQEKFTWKYSTIYADGSIQFERDKRFKELVEQLSNGQIELELHPVGVLSDAGQLLDTVSDGTIEVGGDWPGT